MKLSPDELYFHQLHKIWCIVDNYQHHLQFVGVIPAQSSAHRPLEEILNDNMSDAMREINSLEQFVMYRRIMDKEIL